MWGSDGYTWVLSEIVLGSYPDIVDGLGGQDEVDLAFRGAFTQVPSNGAGTPAYTSMAERWSNTANTATNGLSGGCSEDTDDFGYYMWQQDKASPGLRTTPVANASNMLCAGFDPSHADWPPSQYVPQVTHQCAPPTHILPPLAADALPNEPLSLSLAGTLTTPSSPWPRPCTL